MWSLNGKNGLKDMSLMANIALEINEKFSVAHRGRPLQRLTETQITLNMAALTPCRLPTLAETQSALNVQSDLSLGG